MRLTNLNSNLRMAVSVMMRRVFPAYSYSPATMRM